MNNKKFDWKLWFHIVSLSISLVVVGYLTYLSLNTGNSSICDINDSLSCSKVNSSEYSKFLGVPIVFGGLLLVASNIFTLLVRKLKAFEAFYLSSKSLIVNSQLLINTLAVLVSLLLIYLQGFVIGAFCLFCLVFDMNTIAYSIFLWADGTKKDQL